MQPLTSLVLLLAVSGLCAPAAALRVGLIQWEEPNAAYFFNASTGAATGAQGGAAGRRPHGAAPRSSPCARSGASCIHPQPPHLLPSPSMNRRL